MDVPQSIFGTARYCGIQPGPSPERKGNMKLRHKAILKCRNNSSSIIVIFCSNRWGHQNAIGKRAMSKLNDGGVGTEKREPQPTEEGAKPSVNRLKPPSCVCVTYPLKKDATKFEEAAAAVLSGQRKQRAACRTYAVNRTTPKGACKRYRYVARRHMSARDCARGLCSRDISRSPDHRASHM